MSVHQHLSDQQLVERCHQGDGSAFEALVQRYISRLYDYCRRMLGSKEEAEDAVQETFAAVFNGLATFQGDSSFATWIFRIAHNKSLDTLRRRKALSHQVIYSDGVDPDTAGDPLNPLVNREEADILWDCVNRLPPNYRTVILLFYREDMTYEEIAQVLGIPRRTVETRLYRARRVLRQQWNNWLPLEVDQR